jgi:pyruvate/2-oxoacid:ferredoxin oxidoreductase beta subunit
MPAPATVRLPTRQTFGCGEGVTLSVVRDMARKSPTSINTTMSVGVSTGCRVTISPTTSSMTTTSFLTMAFSV